MTSNSETGIRMFPMQVTQGYNREEGRLAEPIYMAAYEVYCHVYAPQQAMVDFEKGCRGGFSSAEIIAFLYARSFPKSEWRWRVDAAHKGIKGLK
jgi:hypothetical protein